MEKILPEVTGTQLISKLLNIFAYVERKSSHHCCTLEVLNKAKILLTKINWKYVVFLQLVRFASKLIEVPRLSQFKIKYKNINYFAFN